MAAFKNKDNGTWYVQFRYTDWKGERQQKLKRGFATKREALEWEREFLMEKQADVNMSFESFVALYEKDIKPKLKLNTWLTKESIIKKKILPYFANRKLSEITAKDIIRWQNEIRELRDCQTSVENLPEDSSQPTKCHFQPCCPFLRSEYQPGPTGWQHGGGGTKGDAVLDPRGVHQIFRSHDGQAVVLLRL